MLRLLTFGVLVLAAALARAPVVLACPLCCGPYTFSDAVERHDAVAIATLIERPLKPPGDKDDHKCDHAKALFRMDHVLKGKSHFAVDEAGKPWPLRVLHFGKEGVGTRVLIAGAKSDELHWAVDAVLTSRGVEYLRRLTSLPAGAPERLAFFAEHLQDADRQLAADAFDELARASYRELKALRPRLEPDGLRKSIADKDIGPARKRLYLQMLAVCGNRDDVPMLLGMLKAQPEEEGRLRAGASLEPIVVAYLALSGSEKAVDLIDELFLANKESPYLDLYGATSALRLIGQEESTKVSRKRILRSFHYLLDRPEYADLVIPDLARWEDWSVMDRLVELFKRQTDATVWVRMPVVLYLKVCPLPRAKQQLAELSQIDPEVIQRADQALAYWNSVHADHPWRLQPALKR